MIDIWLRGDPQDGNDPIEATINLPGIPRAGDMIEVWDPEGGGLIRSIQVVCPTCVAQPGERCRQIVKFGDGQEAVVTHHSNRTERTGEPRWLKVDSVIWHPYNKDLDGGGEIEVWVTYDGYDLEEFQQTMKAANEAAQS